jgi:MFS family permease
MGKVYKFYAVKPVYLASVIVFEVGSAVCATAPSSNAFIVGRGIAGLGSSGIFSGGMVILFHTVPLRQRPIYQGCFGAIFAIASVVGPLLGGIFTDKITWRWCFYINLPVGALSIIVTSFLLKLTNQKLDTKATGLIPKLKQLDPIGNLIFFPGVISLILALQLGGSRYSWGNARIILLFVLSTILCLTFIGIQIRKQEKGILPPRIVKQRSIAAATFFSFFSQAGSMILLYYLPIWFQAIRGVSAIRSGILMLFLILSVVVGSLSSGILVSKLGFYNPFMILGSILTCIGAGLMTTFAPSTGPAKWISYQVLFGLGAGLSMQQPMNVIQAVLGRQDIATGSALIMFMRFLGSAIFLQVAESIFLRRLTSELTNVPAITAGAVRNAGVTELRTLAVGDDLRTLISDYNISITTVFYLVAGTTGLTVFGSLFVEWRSLKSRASESIQVRNNSKGETTEGSEESMKEERKHSA